MKRIRNSVLAASICLCPAAILAQSAPFGEAAAIPAVELGVITGMADTNMEVRAQNTSTVSHNSVSGQSQTGTISFDAQAFQNMSGLALLSANTGNNVSINSSLNVNVAVRP